MSAISGVSGSSNAWAAASSQRSQHQAKMFAKADSDNSGGVNTSELSSMLSDISSKTGASLGDSSELFAKMDSDGDGSLTSTELDEGMKANVPRHPPPSTMDFAQSRGMSSSSASSGTDEKADALFASVDANSDGSLDTDEMEALMARVQSDTGEDVSDKIAALDEDGDGSLSKSEFDAGKPSGPQGMPPGGPPPGGGPGGPGGPGGAGGASEASDTTTTYDALDTNEDGTVSTLERLAGDLEKLASSSDEEGTSQAKDSSSGGGLNAEIAKFAQALYQQISSNANLSSAFSATA
jgi:Ca2+-binding EF-hand superfamily protein